MKVTNALRNFDVEVIGSITLSSIASKKLNLLSSLANINNLIWLKDAHKHFLNPVNYLNSDLGFLKLFSILDNKQNYEVKSFHVEIYDNSILVNPFLTEEPINTIEGVLSRFQTKVKKGNKVSLVDIYLSYIFCWQNFDDIQVLDIIVNDKKRKDYKRLLNYSIYRNYIEYKLAASFDIYLQIFFKKYLAGYIISEEFFIERFFLKIKLFVFFDSVKNENFEIKKLLGRIRSKDNEHDSTSLITQSFRCLASFCNQVFIECSESECQTEIILSHSKLKGLIKLLITLFNRYDYLKNNLKFRIIKDLFEEIYCDAGSYGSSIYPSQFQVPSFSYSFFLLFTYPKNECSQEKLNLFLKERLVLSKKALSIISKNGGINPDNFDVILRDLKNTCAEFDERLLIPLYELCNIVSTFWRREKFTEHEFKEMSQELNYVGDIEDLYNLYSDEVKSLSGRELNIIFKIHSNLCKLEIKKMITENIENNLSQEKVNYYTNLFPCCGPVLYEGAIFHDKGKKYSKALYLGCNCLFLDVTNKLYHKGMNVFEENNNQTIFNYSILF